MLEIRQHCENCAKSLPNDSNEAMICSYECTFCSSCVEHIIKNVCPNCGGGFEKRPSRPHSQLEKYPMRTDQVYKPVVENKFLKSNKEIDPRKR